MDDLTIDEINEMQLDEMYDMEIAPLEEECFEPHIGMEFRSQKAAYDFYNAYGYITGFSVRSNSFYKNKEGVITSIRMVCSKEGYNSRQKGGLEEPLEMVGGSEERTPQKQTFTSRCGCKAKCHVRLHKDGFWKITSLHKDHNHEFLQNTPSKKRHLRSHKYISIEDREDIRLLSKQNVGSTQMREYLADKAGGRTNLHYSKKDINNQLASTKRKLVGVDVNAMLDYFQRRQQVDQDFFFAIEPDEDNAAQNIFWIDGRSRRAYKEFGDVVTFDTTYQTNKYSMPMAPFLGVNHHRQTIFFGCALIRNEKKTTFVWLLETWLEAVGGKKPQTILTDQDPAMKAAIEMVFGGETVHRCCIWHVMKNARDHLAKLYGSVEGLKEELEHVIKFSWTVVDFEANWCATLKKYKVEDNSHLNLMFDKRDEWAPAYFRDIFFAGMCSTQRSESINSLTKIWMGCNTSLYDFATRFEKMVEGIYERESDEDIRSMNELVQLWSNHPIEHKARQEYTRSVFSLFKSQWKRCIMLSVREVEEGKLYEVSPVKV